MSWQPIPKRRKTCANTKISVIIFSGWNISLLFPIYNLSNCLRNTLDIYSHLFIVIGTWRLNPEFCAY